MGIMKKAGQYQIIIGNDVGNVFAELNKLGNFSSEAPKTAEAKKEKQNLFSVLMDTISGIMAPVIPAIIGAAMIKVLLTLLPMIGVLGTEGYTYQPVSYTHLERYHGEEGRHIPIIYGDYYFIEAISKLNGNQFHIW